MRTSFQNAVILCSAILLSACQNSALKRLSASSSNVGANGASNVVISMGTFKIARVDVGSTASSGSTGLPVTLTFDTTANTTSMGTNCTADTGSNPCVCKFVWNETNSSSGSALTFTHKAYTNVTSVQGAAVQCTTPTLWSTEIADNTSVTISVEPASTNSSSFTVTPFAYTKGQTTATGDFTDSMGRSFVNVLRYSCYEQRQRGLSLVNKIGSQSTTNYGSFNFVIANQFCLMNYKGEIKGGSGSECGLLSQADYSAQSYYYNMYIRDSESGDINPGNAVFVCPKVTEALNEQKDGSGNPIAGTQGKFWPLDSNFALSLGKTSDFSVGVVAHTKTTNVGDPTAQNTACDGTSSSPSSANSIISSCLGFAAKTAVDGTCPKLTANKVSGSCPTGSVSTSSGCVMPTYRLRRYFATYPSIYDTDGNIIPESQRVDTVYVLDRPVMDSTGSNILLDANGVPYSMLGPKPCPYAFFDAPNVTGTGIGYHGTNDSNWDNKNVDNIFFPYQDTGPASTGTCAAMLPQNDPTLTKVSITTLSSKLYVRPITSWSPHYEEDTGFQACAPQSNPLRDPPLHFAYNGSNMAWCAEVYPSQNDNSTKLPPGATNYTSHKVHDVTPNTACSTSIITGHGANNATCDRTVVNPSSGITWPKFPLLAPEADVTKALQSDKSFGCMMTYDNNGGKVNTSDFTLGSTPSQGCCSNAAPPAGAGNSAHLEPTSAPTTTPAVYTPSCIPPKY